nr:hypothetical protein [Tanacetum cinerariifolium]
MGLQEIANMYINLFEETDTQEKDENKAKNDKTEHEMEKIEKDKVIRSQKSKVKARGQQKSTPGKSKSNSATPKQKKACLKCNSGAGNSFVYDPNLKSFNEVQIIFNPPPQSHYNIYLCQIYESNSYYGYECSQRVPLIYEPEPCYNQGFGDNAYSYDSPGITPNIDHHCCYTCEDSLDGFFCHQCTCEFCGNGAHYSYNCPSHVPFTKTLPSVPQQYFVVKIMGYAVNPSLNIQNELDNHELFINVLIQQKLQDEFAQPFPAITITFDLPIMEPKDSLRMGDEHLDTIPEIESNEFIKSSVENLVPILSESKDLSDSECDVPACNDFTTFSNILFDADDDFSSKSLLNHDSLIISSSKIDSLLDEFADELILLKSIPLGIDKAECDPDEEIRLIEKFLYDNSSPRPPKEFISENSDAAIGSFFPSPIPVEDNDSLRDEIDLSLTSDDLMPPGIKDDEFDSEGNMLIFEELLSNDSLSLSENESFHFDIPSSPCPRAKPPDDDEIEPNLEILTVKVVGDISEHYVLMPNPPLLQIKRNLLISYLIGALKLFSILLNSR